MSPRFLLKASGLRRIPPTYIGPKSPVGQTPKITTAAPAWKFPLADLGLWEVGGRVGKVRRSYRNRAEPGPAPAESDQHRDKDRHADRRGHARLGERGEQPADGGAPTHFRRVRPRPLRVGPLDDKGAQARADHAAGDGADREKHRGAGDGADQP